MIKHPGNDDVDLVKEDHVYFEVSKFEDNEFPLRTNEFISRLKEGEKLNDLLPEAFALVREASKRINNERHFDVQLIGGMVLHEGQIAEMKTGEGKTLVASRLTERPYRLSETILRNISGKIRNISQ